MSVTLIAECRPKIQENRKQRRIFGSKKNKGKKAGNNLQVRSFVAYICHQLLLI